ncbi:hypothetical protein PoB_006236500 [Plakobranchus ocellatus]|uniref:Uncharacterized protein n=1 Tax=Plakobranchus ocellatus TaxID=259542 RepID=A0AAV4CVG9_9GAST|nr:hypothetical protein PoB_006236500 [Plakobranchus ocellatus]
MLGMLDITFILAILPHDATNVAQKSFQDVALPHVGSDPARPKQGDLRLSGPPSGQGGGAEARTRDGIVPADLRADSLATVPPTPRR